MRATPGCAVAVVVTHPPGAPGAGGGAARRSAFVCFWAGGGARARGEAAAACGGASSSAVLYAQLPLDGAPEALEVVAGPRDPSSPPAPLGAVTLFCRAGAFRAELGEGDAPGRPQADCEVRGDDPQALGAQRVALRPAAVTVSHLLAVALLRVAGVPALGALLRLWCRARAGCLRAAHAAPAMSGAALLLGLYGWRCWQLRQACEPCACVLLAAAFVRWEAPRIRRIGTAAATAVAARAANATDAPSAWLSALVAALWPLFLEQRLSAFLQVTVQRQLDRARPGSLSALRLTRLRLGDSPIAISNVRVARLTGGARGQSEWHADMEGVAAGFDVVVEANVALTGRRMRAEALAVIAGVGGAAGLPLRVYCSRLSFLGRIRVAARFDASAALVAMPIGALRVSFVRPPALALSLRPTSRALGNLLPPSLAEIPSIAKWVDEHVSRLIKDNLVEPKSILVNLQQQDGHRPRPTPESPSTAAAERHGYVARVEVEVFQASRLIQPCLSPSGELDVRLVARLGDQSRGVDASDGQSTPSASSTGGPAVAITSLARAGAQSEAHFEERLELDAWSWDDMRLSLVVETADGDEVGTRTLDMNAVLDAERREQWLALEPPGGGDEPAGHLHVAIRVSPGFGYSADTAALMAGTPAAVRAATSAAAAGGRRLRRPHFFSSARRSATKRHSAQRRAREAAILSAERLAAFGPLARSASGCHIDSIAVAESGDDEAPARVLFAPAELAASGYDPRRYAGDAGCDASGAIDENADAGGKACNGGVSPSFPAVYLKQNSLFRRSKAKRVKTSLTEPLGRADDASEQHVSGSDDEPAAGTSRMPAIVVRALGKRPRLMRLDTITEIRRIATSLDNLMSARTDDSCQSLGPHAVSTEGSVVRLADEGGSRLFVECGNAASAVAFEARVRAAAATTAVATAVCEGNAPRVTLRRPFRLGRA